MADKMFLSVCCFVALLIDISKVKSHGLTRLEPEKPLLNQVLHHKETVLYRLVNLVARRSYELRVSYPATTPTDFLIHLVSQESVRGGQSRKLLNIDKIMFNNDVTLTEQFANVTAIRTGVPYDPNRLSDPVHYNIVLEELFFGVPWHVWRLALIVLLSVSITLKYLVPCFLSFIEEHIKRVNEKRKS